MFEQTLNTGNRSGKRFKETVEAPAEVKKTATAWPEAAGLFGWSRSDRLYMNVGLRRARKRAREKVWRPSLKRQALHAPVLPEAFCQRRYSSFATPRRECARDKDWHPSPNCERHIGHLHFYIRFPVFFT